MLKRMLAILTLTGLSVFLIGAASAHNADDVKRHGKSLVGSWIVSVTADGDVVPPFTNLTAITRDGAVINSDPSFATGVGVWKHAQRRQFSVRFLHLVPLDDPDFPPGTSITVTSRVTVNNDGASASGPFLAVFENPAIGEFFRFTGTAAFERITIHDDD